MPSRAAHLFVYGTLRPDAPGRFGKAQRDRLAGESRLLGMAVMPGRLVDAGSYPGLIEPSGEADVVHGVVVLLDDAQRSFRWLDPYEGISTEEPEHNEYVRERREVCLADGQFIEAWVYVYRPSESLPIVPGGNWVAT